MMRILCSLSAIGASFCAARRACDGVPIWRRTRPPAADRLIIPGAWLRTHAKNTLRTAPLQPAPEPVYEGGARSPTKPTNPYIVVIISQKRHFEQQKCKGFLHRLCKGFFGRVYRKNGAKREFWPSFGRKRPPSPRKSGKKRGGGLICRRRSRYRRCPACRGRRRRRGGSTPGAGAGEAPRAAARSPRG